MKSTSLAALLHAFFHEWMGKQRNLSRHTVCSYRDTWKLFLRFVSERRRREVADLALAVTGNSPASGLCGEGMQS